MFQIGYSVILMNINFKTMKEVELKNVHACLYMINPIWENNNFNSALVRTSFGHEGMVYRKDGTNRGRYRVYKKNGEHILAYLRSITVLEYFD